MFILNGIVGGKPPINVAGRSTIQLQQIALTVQGGHKLTLKSLTFLFNNDAFAIKIEALPSTGKFIVRGGIGDSRPNKVLFNNTSKDAVIIFLLVSAVNTARNTRSLSRSDTWHLVLSR